MEKTVKNNGQNKTSIFLRKTKAGIAFAEIALAFTIGCGGSSSVPTPKKAPPITLSTDAINETFEYSGPTKNADGKPCNQRSATVVLSQNLNGEGKIIWKTEWNTSNCSLTITSVESQVSQLAVDSVFPELPFTLPPGSRVRADITLKLSDPDKPYVDHPISVLVRVK
jgi:hypothetical protein